MSEIGETSEISQCLTSYWRKTAIEALLELAALKALINEDLVELVAQKRLKFYQAVGGTELTLATFRAKTRHYMATGEEI